MLKTPIGRVRLVGILEAISFLGLLGIGLPLKYMVGLPIVVQVLGPVHGLLFIGYCFAITEARLAAGWSLGRCAWLVFVALLPAGPLFIDGRLKREDAALQDTTTEDETSA